MPSPGPESPTFPPEPWHLHGHAYVGVWLLPRHAAPPPHHTGTPPIRVLGRCVVAAAFFRYDDPSPLTYDEVMTTVLVRDGWRPRVSITHIWVDSPASRDGGRALWAIPKDLAVFERETDRSYEASGIAGLRVRGARALPLRLPFAFRLTQDRDGRPITSPVRGSARLGVVRSRWSFDPDGPMSFLRDRRPVVTLRLGAFRLAFGQT